MAFIGNTPTTQAFTPAVDYFSGNGSTTAFTLSRPVASVAQVQVTIDNVAQNPSSAFTVSANTITFTSAPLSGTNNIYVYYTSPITQVIAPGQGTVNTTALGNITNIASGNSSLTLQTGSGNTTAVTVDTSQNVGVGNTTPSSYNLNAYKLVIGSNSAVTGMTLASGTSAAGNIFFARGTTGADAYDGYVQYAQSGQYMAFGTNGGTERMRIDSSGNVGIGRTSPAAKLDVAGDIRSSNYFQLSSGSDAKYYGVGSALTGIYASTDLAIWNVSAGNTVFYQNGAERMRINSAGNLYVNTTTALSPDNAYLSVAGSSSLPGITVLGGSGPWAIKVGTVDTTSTRYMIGICNNSGATIGGITTNGSNVAYNTSSDYRLKEDIQPMTGALAKVLQLKPVTYKWKSNGEDGEGFIAHELKEVCPHAVSGEKDELDKNGDIKPQGIDASFLVATLTAAIQELKAINDTQAATITALTARIVALENR